jgi:hypothetical protein
MVVACTYCLKSMLTTSMFVCAWCNILVVNGCLSVWRVTNIVHFFFYCKKQDFQLTIYTELFYTLTEEVSTGCIKDYAVFCTYS